MGKEAECPLEDGFWIAGLLKEGRTTTATSSETTPKLVYTRVSDSLRPTVPTPLSNTP